MNKIIKLNKKINNKYYYHDYIHFKVLNKIINDYLLGKISENEYHKNIFNYTFYNFSESEKEYY